MSVSTCLVLHVSRTCLVLHVSRTCLVLHVSRTCLVLQVSQWYDLVVFTASMEIYGAAVADKLDGGRGLLPRRYYRQHCTLDYGSYTKDLAAICPDLASIFILDNSPGAYRAYPGKS